MQHPEERLYKGLMHLIHLKLLSVSVNSLICAHIKRTLYLPILFVEVIEISAILIQTLYRPVKTTYSQKSLKRNVKRTD